MKIIFQKQRNRNHIEISSATKRPKQLLQSLHSRDTKSYNPGKVKWKKVLKSSDITAATIVNDLQNELNFLMQKEKSNKEQARTLAT